MSGVVKHSIVLTLGLQNIDEGILTVNAFDMEGNLVGQESLTELVLFALEDPRSRSASHRYNIGAAGNLMLVEANRLRSVERVLFVHEVQPEARDDADRSQGAPRWKTERLKP